MGIEEIRGVIKKLKIAAELMKGEKVVTLANFSKVSVYLINKGEIELLIWMSSYKELIKICFIKTVII
ncbi:MAG: hypothetical protein ACRC6K_06225 [Fusobacteriaceae bacterium]